MAVDTNQSILYVASHGMEDSYRATLIFAAARAVKAAAAAADVKVALLGEATWLANQRIQENFSLGPVTYKVSKGEYTRPQLPAMISELVTKYHVPIGV